MRSGFLPARVVHVHPTRLCNLACAHCYSESSPGEREALDVEVLIGALGELREEGYEILSISGGEPLVYRDLERLISAAAGQGYRVHLITNGLLLNERHLGVLAAHAPLVGVSLDGAEETHNQVRGRPDAYDGAIRAMRLLAAAKIPFGIIYAVSARSIGDVPWAYELAMELGALLLHLRPLAPEGRGKSLANSWMLSEEDCARLFVLAEILKEPCANGPHVQLDLASVEELLGAREQFELLRPAPKIERLSDAVNPLIIDSQGRCFPFVYGVDGSFALQRIAWRNGAWKFRPNEEALHKLQDLLETAFAELEGSEGKYVDFFTHLVSVSRAIAAEPGRRGTPAVVGAGGKH